MDREHAIDHLVREDVGEGGLELAAKRGACDRTERVTVQTASDSNLVHLERVEHFQRKLLGNIEALATDARMKAL